MRRRRSYDLTVAAIETAFAIAAFGCVLFDAHLWIVGLAGIGMMAYRNCSRRVVLNRLLVAAWITVSTVVTIAIIAIIDVAYWLGLASGVTI
jgi:hypothetical protein